MHSSIVLTSLAAAGSAYASVAQGSWSVRADFSRCDRKFPLEAMLDGAESKSSPAVNVTDFKISAPFEGSLIIKMAGAVGSGSPYQPQRVVVEVFGQAVGHPGVWANATVKPGYENRGSISQIGWNTGNYLQLNPGEKEDVSIETTVDGGVLVVDYCGIPDKAAPAA